MLRGFIPVSLGFTDLTSMSSMDMHSVLLSLKKRYEAGDFPIGLVLRKSSTYPDGFVCLTDCAECEGSGQASKAVRETLYLNKAETEAVMTTLQMVLELQGWA